MTFSGPLCFVMEKPLLHPTCESFGMGSNPQAKAQKVGVGGVHRTDIGRK